jgi:hypothetical protein
MLVWRRRTQDRAAASVRFDPGGNFWHFQAVLSVSVCGVNHRQAKRSHAMIVHRLSKTVHDVGFRILAKA